jgi:O-antigen ligase/tetratricopeptide (TPR) repeat protein
MNKMTKQQLAVSLIAVLCVLWGLLMASSLWWGLLPVYLLMLLRFRKTDEPYQLQKTDIAIWLIAVAEALLYFWSSYPANSVSFPLVFLCFTLLWFFLQQRMREPAQQQFMLSGLAAIGGLLALFTLFFFLFYWVKVRDMGFEDITQFRFLYRPMGMLSNDWVSIMLAFLPFAAATCFSSSGKYACLSGIACAFITISIIISHSRGAIFTLFFLGLLVLALLLYYRIYTIRKLLLGSCICIAVLAVVCMPVRSSLHTTLVLTENVSQVRSIEGRINKWHDAWELFRQHPTTGVGAGNFALRAEPPGNQRETMFTARGTNSWLQLAAEKGICGLAVYGLFLALWLIQMVKILRKRNKTQFVSVVCAAGVLACLLRETSFSTLFEKPILLLLLMLLLWFSLHKPGRALATGRVGNRCATNSLCVTLIMLLLLAFGLVQTKQEIALRHNRTFIRAYDAEDKNALAEIQKSIRLFPQNALLHANEGLYLMAQLSRSDSLPFPVGNLPDSLLQRAIAAFEKAVALNPSDASFRCNLGMLHFFVGDTVSGKQHLEKAIRLHPHQTIYHVLYGSIFENDSITPQRYAKAIYYSPDVLDSRWFNDLSARLPTIAAWALSKAQKMLSDSLVQYPSPLLKARLAKVLLHQGETMKAEQLLHAVTRTMPNLNRPWLLLGDIAADRHDTSAIQFYERALLLDPSDAYAQLRTGDWYMSKDNRPKAFGYYMDGLRAMYGVPTEHSIRCISMYHAHTASDDLIPFGFLWDVKPDMNVPRIAEIIAQGFEQEGNTDQAKLYLQFADGSIDLRQLMNKLKKSH